MDRTKKLSWGEDLQVEVERFRKRTGTGFDGLTTVLDRVERGARNTYRRLLALDAPPELLADRVRAYLVLLALDLEPRDYKVVLGEDERPILWPDDAELSALIKALLER